MPREGAHDAGAREARAIAYRRWYARLLRLYPRDYRERFGASMEQTFNDLCRERLRTGRSLFGLAAWTFADTSIAIVREGLMSLVINHRSLVRVAAVTATILAIPVVMMIIESGRAEKNWIWGPLDFVIMGALLFATGMAIEVALKLLKTPLSRGLAVAFIVLACVAIWAELAVDAVSQMIGWVTGG